MNVIITGFLGTGKSTVGKLLAKRLGRSFLDTDALIEKETGLSVRQIFKLYGEEHFRHLEKMIVRELAGEPKNLVIATGGKTLLDEDNLAAMLKTGIVICLEDRPENIWSKLKFKSKRPVIEGFSLADFIELYEKRKSGYQVLPNKIQTTGLSAVEVTNKVFNFLNQEAACFDVVVGRDNSKIYLRRFVTLQCEEIVKNCEGKAYFVIDRQLLRYDGNIFNLGGRPVFEMPATDSHKNLKQAESIWRWLLMNEVKRDSVLVSIGGGVVGDMCGFVASTMLRGITHYHFPTTLLAMVDSCLGGKNGVNLGRIKNCLGTFYSPKLVVINPFLLYSLPYAEITSGLVEVIKAGLIADMELPVLVDKNLEMIKNRDAETVETLILRALLVKKKIVEKDPYEAGLRKQLNLGHTLGHALEAYTNFKISHGQAVAVGLIFALGLSEKLGFCPPGYRENVKNIICRLGLKTEIRADKNKILDLMRYDKKSTATGLDFVLFHHKKGILLDRVERKLIEETLEEVLNENTCYKRTQPESARKKR